MTVRPARNLVAALAGVALAAGLAMSVSSASSAVQLPRAKPAPAQEAAATPATAPSVSPEKAVPPAKAASSLPARIRMDAPARDYFGKIAMPSRGQPEAIGSYARGCQSGAVALAQNGPGWQVMRLSRNRFWGQPELIDYLEDLARDAPKLGWRGLMIGDMAQPRGGPMTSGHASHQIGLDADIWLKQMPDHVMSAAEREDVSAVSMLRGRIDVAGADRTVDPKKFTPAHARLIRRAAQDPRVERIFVTPGIKKALCDFETGDRSWLRVVRPWWGHHYHFHVRLKCPAGDGACADQASPPPGDGCGRELASWMADDPWVPKPGAKPGKPKPPLALAALPNACIGVLQAR